MALRLSILGQAAEKIGSPGDWTLAADGGRIGRSGDNDWVLKDPDRYISAHHAEIELRDGGWWVKDLSTNGTFINGSSRPLGTDSSYRLSDGDRIRFGSIEVVAEILEDGKLASGRGFDLASDMLDESLEVKSLLSIDATGRRSDAFGQPLPERRQSVREAEPGESKPAELWPGLVAFCKGAGIDPYSLPAAQRSQVLQEAGQAVREMVLGLNELSRLRVEFRHEVGISESGKQPDATGLLAKVSVTEEALIKLLADSGPDAERAVDEVRRQFARTRHHQQSVVLALREALAALLDRLDPDELERQFGGTTRGPASVENQARNWTRYREIHHAMAANDQMGLPAAFVEEFAKAFQTLAAVGLRATIKSGESR